MSKTATRSVKKHLPSAESYPLHPFTIMEKFKIPLKDIIGEDPMKVVASFVGDCTVKDMLNYYKNDETSDQFFAFAGKYLGASNIKDKESFQKKFSQVCTNCNLKTDTSSHSYYIENPFICRLCEKTLKQFQYKNNLYIMDVYCIPEEVLKDITTEIATKYYNVYVLSVLEAEELAKSLRNTSFTDDSSGNEKKRKVVK